ncbi:DUF1570 domain-containing protein [Leucothrix pacifica]|uniref:DUF1570 domain-containing protein n=1 Tax=Leucothrix pacifica TaxID=1247513 RepID=A0A317C243_9GAMM|nr:DUF1570 domain-containing protein [Leucothrix pacifica]PWQ92695.1 hypothetical protein DKW60_19840 [Leucothrix pacifica]
MSYTYVLKLVYFLVALNAITGCIGDNKQFANQPQSSVEQLNNISTAIKKVKKLAPNYVTEVSYPFVITGDLALKQMKFWRRKIQRSQRALKKQFFRSDPSQVIIIWLFKSEASYTENNQRLWGFIPDTPYGYFDPSNKRMVMNIASGGGTLTHELVHPYITQNFPESPLWFHEGLASLYERSRYSGGYIYGMNNWRLASLTALTKAKASPNLSTMMSSGDGFYGKDRETSYAKARYLMFYLQSRRLLKRYYRTYRDSVANDPSGIKALLEVTNESNISSLESKWVKFVSRQHL